MTKEQLEQQERELELEERKAALEARKLENAKLLREADKHKMEADGKAARDKRTGEALTQQRPENRFKAVRRTCNHKMGGKSRENLMTGRGNSDQYCVVKVKLPTGDVMVRCQRCRTVWVPPLEADYTVNGKLNRDEFVKAQEEYNEAYNFETQLAMVVLPQYRWSRGGKPVNREVTHRFVKGIIGK
jgi:predicted Zn finger-like uncharacterized protein